LEESQLTFEEKHKLYESSVQNHENDINLINENFFSYFNKYPLSLREDFGGTGLLACGWVAQSDEHQAWAIDLDPEPIAYGKETHYKKLPENAKSRIKYIEGNVLDNFSFKTDVAVAFNFSYFIFKKRKDLLSYFKKVRESLKDDGAFFIDLFGGTEAYTPMVEETEHEDFSYFWDCDMFNPITHECLYHIHFKTHHDNKMHRNVFTYDWRMWGIPELREILEEAGFTKTIAFWEGDDEEGSGDGTFLATEVAENCESWVTYIMAIK
jgi:hypothetical protein